MLEEGFQEESEVKNREKYNEHCWNESPQDYWEELQKIIEETP